MEVKFEKYIRDTLEAKEFKSAFEYFFDIIWQEVLQRKKNTRLKTMDLTTTVAWERFLKITPNDSLTLDERRNNVIAHKLAKPPYSLNNIRQQLSGLTGKDVQILYDDLNLKITVVVPLLTDYEKTVIESYLNKVKPTNVIYLIRTETNDWQEVYEKYNWETLSEKTWEDVFKDPNF